MAAMLVACATPMMTEESTYRATAELYAAGSLAPHQRLPSDLEVLRWQSDDTRSGRVAEVRGDCLYLSPMIEGISGECLLLPPNAPVFAGDARVDLRALAPGMPVRALVTADPEGLMRISALELLDPEDHARVKEQFRGMAPAPTSEVPPAQRTDERTPSRGSRYAHPPASTPSVRGI